MALDSLKKPSDVTLYTDSKYVKQGVEEWLAGWKAKGWKTAAKKPVKNKELWERIDSLMNTHNVKLIWVKGHAGTLKMSVWTSWQLMQFQEVRKFS